jgi:hypothetical protein
MVLTHTSALMKFSLKIAHELVIIGGHCTFPEIRTHGQVETKLPSKLFSGYLGLIRGGVCRLP